MVRRKYRLSASSDIIYVLKRGQRVRGKFFSINWTTNSVKLRRFTVIVSNNVSKKATQRNIIKRRLRALVALFSDRMKDSIDVVVVAHPGITERTFQELKISFEGLLSPLCLQKETQRNAKNFTYSHSGVSKNNFTGS